MTKQEIIEALAKAKRQLNVAKEADEKQFAQKKVAKFEAQLAELSDAVTGSSSTVELLEKIEKAKRQLKVAKEADEKEFAQKKLKKLELELASTSDKSKAITEAQAENKEILKEIVNVQKNETIPTEVKAKLVAKIKEEANSSMEEEKKAIKEHAKATTKPKKEKAKVRLEKAKERKKDVKELVSKVSRKHEDKDKFKDLIKRLTDTGKYDFLKGMSKDDVERDMKRLAKPMGWRFRGKGNYKNPNRAEIKAGIKSGAVYYETRPERSDVSKSVKLAKGSTIAGAKEYILCETVSGENYSEPEFTVFPTLKDAVKELNSKKHEFEGDLGYLLDEQKPALNVVKEYDFSDPDDDDTDYHKLQIIEVPSAHYHLIRYEEPNEVSIESFKSELFAKKEMKKDLKKIVWEDEDEFDEYDGGNEFGAHSEDGFMGLYIVSLKK